MAFMMATAGHGTVPLDLRYVEKMLLKLMSPKRWYVPMLLALPILQGLTMSNKMNKIVDSQKVEHKKGSCVDIFTCEIHATHYVCKKSLVTLTLYTDEEDLFVRLNMRGT
ncbi:hypothetical protein TNCV_1053451 [Trichonephila clavipes]|nr:hypothetical protein TNCV_1053451 [Trichonephila clavipes]